jgi:hypothetical protein
MRALSASVYHYSLSDRAAEWARERSAVGVPGAQAVVETVPQDAARAKALLDALEPPAEFPEDYRDRPNISDATRGWFLALAIVGFALP